MVSNNNETAIQVITVKTPINDFRLVQYASKREIDADTLNQHCKEINFTLHNRNYAAIGFKNNAGGFELRNEYFQAAVPPKYIAYLNNGANNLHVFEGFFDFLS